jgi:3-phenylpropionate/trans-cinnamate dioxygenase ferredoxin reductase subunit
MALERIVVVGASLAGLSAARALRDAGYAGALVVVGEEPHLPYDRPPLSKQVLSGEWRPEETALPFDAEALRVDWRLGRRAVALDTVLRRIVLEDGTAEYYDGLVIATGAAPRTIGGEHLAGVHTLRTRDDAVALEADLRAAPDRVVVVGGGFIGAEVAATCRGRDLPVTMIEALPAPLSQALGVEVGERLAAIHREQGVDVRTGVAVRAIAGDGRVERVELSDGTNVGADVVVVAIGVRPSTAWLEGSGLPLEDGVMCDPSCSVAPRIVAAGDVACWPNSRFGEVRRIEHWDNAIRQGEHAALRLLAGDADAGPGAYEPVPWVWSDQYDLKLQLVGSPVLHDEVRTFAASGEPRRFVALYRRGDRLTAAFAVNRARQVMRLRAMISDGAGWDEAVASVEPLAAAQA